MQKFCPITSSGVLEPVARLNAFLTFLFALFFVVFDFWAGMAFLAIDFLIRGFWGSSYSLLAQISASFVRIARIKGRMINAGPKIFAAQVGLVLSSSSLIFYALDCGWICYGITLVLALFSFMEAVFSFCVACKLYPLVRRILP
ncbi:MAG TPA: DUF4395 domain-containing protein [Prolixibacteraceae bacterium]|nr:DUF4395 domain-containing protein [Prolixibacteraceae bacterium]